MKKLIPRMEKIQQKRKNTSWKDFLIDIASRRPLGFYKTDAGMSRYPQTSNRRMNLIPRNEYFAKYYQQWEEWQWPVADMSFFDQWRDLFYETPFPTLNVYGTNNHNADWGDDIRNGAKNIYLTIVAWDWAENICYSYKAETNVTNVFNSVNITQQSENIYFSKTVRQSRNIFYSKYIYNSSDIWFCAGMTWCQECLMCQDLTNQSYCIQNVQYDKETYLSKKKELLWQTSLFESYYDAMAWYTWVIASENVTWQWIYKSQDIENGYEVAHMSSSRNVLYSDGGDGSSMCYDSVDCAADRTQNLYWVLGQAFGEHVYCSAHIVESSFVFYSYMLQNCSYCLWCTRLTNKSYCIFNKQYTKDERYDEVDKIFTQMEKDWQLWEFFPWSMNPFYFNDTMAYMVEPTITKEEVLAKWYLRRDEPIKVDIPAWVQTVNVADMWKFESKVSDKLTINEDVLKKVLLDDQWNAFRIIPMELEFLQRFWLPLPRTHRTDRLKKHFLV